MLNEEQLREIEAALGDLPPGAFWSEAFFAKPLGPESGRYVALACQHAPDLLATVRELQRQNAVLAASIEAREALNTHNCKKNPRWCPHDNIGCQEAFELNSKDGQAWSAAWELLHPKVT